MRTELAFEKNAPNMSAVSFVRNTHYVENSHIHLKWRKKVYLLDEYHLC
jgi:hypothetical protein